MPCHTISTIEVDAGKMNLALAMKALEAMGLCPTTSQGRPTWINHYGGSFDTATGAATWYGQDRTADLKKAYSTEILKSQAARFGWTLKRDVRTQKYTIIKR